MGRTKIEWTNFTINPIKGLCPVDCKDNQGKSYCYARRMYKRFKWNPEIRFDVQPLLDVKKIKKPSRIFVGSMIELFGEWVDAFWLDAIFGTVKDNPQHTFIFLTKQSQSLPKEFPPNCWVGVSTPNASDAINANKYMPHIKASVKFLSIEPMFDWNLFPNTLRGILFGYQWIIIGNQTPYSIKTAPKIGQIQDILVAVDNPLNIPIFMKNKLKPLLNNSAGWQGWKLRQEFPIDIVGIHKETFDLS